MYEIYDLLFIVHGPCNIKSIQDDEDQSHEKVRF